MIDIVLSIVIGLMIGLMAYMMRLHKEEKVKLINALIAKTPQQAVDLTMADRLSVTVPKEEKPPDLVPLDQLSEEDFDRHIEEALHAN